MRVTVQNEPSESAAAGITRDPARLAALCELWKAARRPVWLTLAGYSMAPTLLPGTKVKLDCGCRVEDCAQGDILAFRHGGSLIIHRLTTITGDTPALYICKGDGNPHYDEPVEADAIVGKVVETQPPAVWIRLRKTIGHLLYRYRRRSLARAGRGAV